MAVTDPSFFSLDELRRFLEHTRGSRRITSIREWDGGDALILRHDIDVDPAVALSLAHIEHELGVGSSFCAMTTSDLYNASAPGSRAILREIVDLGFDIGLHFWPAAYPKTEASDLVTHVRDEARRLEDIIGRDIVSVSLHNPSASGEYPGFEGYRCAYDPAMFVTGRYLSDSRMILREDPYAFAERTSGGVAQLLLHPEHFTGSGAGYDEIFRGIEQRRARAIDRYMLVNETYRHAFPEGLFTSLERRAQDDITEAPIPPPRPP